jgi:mannose-6-phosphate isomerase-like protein (cupin superfamily)
MLTYDEFEKFSLSNYALEQKIVSVIDYHGRQIQIESVSQFLSYEGCTIKLEGMEKYNSQIYNYCKYLVEMKQHNGPVTCHAFRAYPDSASFDMHTDPDDVYLYVAQGIKTIQLQSRHVQITKDEVLYIPANTPHRALNTHSSLMLSFGLEKFMCDKAYYELDVLPKNN